MKTEALTDRDRAERINPDIRVVSDGHICRHVPIECDLLLNAITHWQGIFK
jgi:hypothetical protein